MPTGLITLGLVIGSIYLKGPAGFVYLCIALITLTIGLKVLVLVLQPIIAFFEIMEKARLRRAEKQQERAWCEYERAERIRLARLNAPPVDIGELVDRGDGVFVSRRGG